MNRHRPARTYHDDSTWPHLELGPQDDRGYVEQLIKAIFQAGLSWPTIESHWPAFSDVFHDFDPVQVAAMSEQDINRALQNTDIIRNHRKVKAAVTSAAAVNEVVAQYGSFDAYLRSFDSPEKEIANLQHHFAGLGDYSAWDQGLDDSLTPVTRSGPSYQEHEQRADGYLHRALGGPGGPPSQGAGLRR